MGCGTFPFLLRYRDKRCRKRKEQKEVILNIGRIHLMYKAVYLHTLCVRREYAHRNMTKTVIEECIHNGYSMALYELEM